MTLTIAELHALLAAATPPPWDGAISMHFIRALGKERYSWILADWLEYDGWWADKELAVAAVNALGPLLDRLEAAEALVSVLQDAVTVREGHWSEVTAERDAAMARAEAAERDERSAVERGNRLAQQLLEMGREHAAQAERLAAAEVAVARLIRERDEAERMLTAPTHGHLREVDAELARLRSAEAEVARLHRERDRFMSEVMSMEGIDRALSDATELSQLRGMKQEIDSRMAELARLRELEAALLAPERFEAAIAACRGAAMDEQMRELDVARALRTVAPEHELVRLVHLAKPALLRGEDVLMSADDMRLVGRIAAALAKAGDK